MFFLKKIKTLIKDIIDPDMAPYLRYVNVDTTLVLGSFLCKYRTDGGVETPWASSAIMLNGISGVSNLIFRVLYKGNVFLIRIAEKGMENSPPISLNSLSLYYNDNKNLTGLRKSLYAEALCDSTHQEIIDAGEFGRNFYLSHLTGVSKLSAISIICGLYSIIDLISQKENLHDFSKFDMIMNNNYFMGKPWKDLVMTITLDK